MSLNDVMMSIDLSRYVKPDHYLETGEIKGAIKDSEVYAEVLRVISYHDNKVRVGINPSLGVFVTLPGTQTLADMVVYSEKIPLEKADR